MKNPIEKKNLKAKLGTAVTILALFTACSNEQVKTDEAASGTPDAAVAADALPSDGLPGDSTGSTSGSTSDSTLADPLLSDSATQTALAETAPPPPPPEASPKASTGRHRHGHHGKKKAKKHSSSKVAKNKKHKKKKKPSAGAKGSVKNRGGRGGVVAHKAPRPVVPSTSTQTAAANLDSGSIPASAAPTSGVLQPEISKSASFAGGIDSAEPSAFSLKNSLVWLYWAAAMIGLTIFAGLKLKRRRAGRGALAYGSRW